MGLYDSFLKDDGYDIQVKCFDLVGGTMNVFKKGCSVPVGAMDFDFNIVKEYGENFNIYCYMTEDDVIFIRNGKYVGYTSYLNLTNDDVESIPCIDKHGNSLELNRPSDYIRIKNDFLATISEL